MRVLVTGGAGFIGSCLVDRLVEQGDEVTELDNLSSCRSANLAGVAGLIRFIEGDVLDPALTGVMTAARPEVVYHLAAHIDVRASVDDPIGDARINVLGTIAVAEAARAAGVRKIVNTSSGGSIYGTPDTLPVTEDTPINPLSPYVVAIFTQHLLDGHATPVFGAGGNTRDYVFVADVAAAFLLAAGEVGDRRRYNIGTGIQTSDRDLHSMISQAAGAADEPRRAPARLGDLRHSAIDASRARHELGWAPTHDLRAGIDATVSYFRRRPAPAGGAGDTQ